jgi:heat shock protein HslJ
MHQPRTALALLPLVLWACAAAPAASTPTPAPSPSPSAPPAVLDGRTFLSTAVTRDGAAAQLVPGTQIRLSFNGGQLGASAGCNMMSGAYSLDGDRLLLANAGMTEMGCDAPRQAQDDWLFRTLGGQPTLALSGNDLTVTLGGTVIQLLDREVADPDVQLVGHLWTVESIISGEAVSSVPQGAMATFQFRADGTVDLQTGCNSGGGKYAVNAGTLRFIDIVTTDRACAGPGGELEAAVVRLLSAAGVDYLIDANVLTLRAGDQGLQLRAADQDG